VSQAAAPIIGALPTLPPTPAQPYTGAQATAATRAALQRALDNYKIGQTNLPLRQDSLASETVSFGESHAGELSSISPEHVSIEHGLPLTPPHVSASLPPAEAQDAPPAAKPEGPSQAAVVPKPTDPIDPLTLNQSPTVLPVSAVTTSPTPASTDSSLAQSGGAIPTIAETGLPVSAGAGGPGPASGSLLELQNRTGSSGAPSEGQTGQLAAAPPAAVPTQSYETAVDEKKRLEREERERILREGGQSAAAAIEEEAAPKHEEEPLPPYQPI
jgi:hypothetical protein